MLRQVCKSHQQAKINNTSNVQTSKPYQLHPPIQTSVQAGKKVNSGYVTEIALLPNATTGVRSPHICKAVVQHLKSRGPRFWWIRVQYARERARRCRPHALDDTLSAISNRDTSRWAPVTRVKLRQEPVRRARLCARERRRIKGRSAARWGLVSMPIHSRTRSSNGSQVIAMLINLVTKSRLEVATTWRVAPLIE